jgi:hypothetical protein
VTADLDFPQPRSKLPLVMGGIVAAAAAVGVVIAVASSGEGPPAPTPPTQTQVAVGPTPTIETRPNPMPNTVVEPVEPSTDTGSAPVPTGNFSDLFAAGAEKAGDHGSSGGPFSPEAARRAVAAVLKGVARCKEAGGSTGQATTSITFSSNGSVSSVTVGAPFAGTSTGTCIISALKEAKMPPFSGLPGTISYPLSIQ